MPLLMLRSFGAFENHLLRELVFGHLDRYSVYAIYCLSSKGRAYSVSKFLRSKNVYSSKLLPDVEEYLDELPQKHRDKVVAFMKFLEGRDGVLDQPYSKHLRDKTRELIVNFGNADHRILYTLLPGKLILYLIAFSKKSRKTPPALIEKAVFMRKKYLEFNK